MVKLNGLTNNPKTVGKKENKKTLDKNKNSLYNTNGCELNLCMERIQ